MNITLIVVGKTDKDYIQKACEEYFVRIKRYLNFEFKVIKDIKNAKSLTTAVQNKLEGEKILEELQTSDFVVLLDENGKNPTSKELATFIEKQSVSGLKNLVFVIGGPYGFSQDVYSRANYKLSLSKMTFSHQLVRAIFAEQLYRALSIINNDPYHHE
ncbi:MAG: 23S rRNA (pseudouridine(1915)-N(3))-methyltransferase RlmH [Bacteroidales bacterium]|nr:23S rRNA (pseudouridine(1915)-N(3))-methyltransferase RlmH [Bacteroidales bacterium]